MREKIRRIKEPSKDFSMQCSLKCEISFWRLNLKWLNGQGFFKEPNYVGPLTYLSSVVWFLSKPQPNLNTTVPCGVSIKMIVLRVLDGCFKGISKNFRWNSKEVLKMFNRCFKRFEASKMIKWFKYASGLARKFQNYLKKIFRVFPWVCLECFKIQKYFKGPSRKCQGCPKKVLRVFI